MRHILILIILLFFCSCKVIRPKKDYGIVSVWAVPFENMYYAGPRMSTIKGYMGDYGSIGKRIDDKKLYIKLNDFIDNVDSNTLNDPTDDNTDPFADVLIEFKRKGSDSIVKLGLNKLGMVGYMGKTYLTNDSLVNMIQPYVKSKFRKRFFPQD